MKKILILICMAAMCSCASVAPVYKHDYDFSKIKTIYVEEFGYTNTGKIVQNAVIKQLMIKGFDIKSSYDNNVDIIVSGTVSQYQPSKTYLVKDYDTSPNIIIYNDSPFEISGSTIYDSGSAFGMNDAKLYSSTASVGLSISMKDPETGEIVWTNSYTYEGFDIDSSVDGSVKYILKTFPPQNQQGE